MRSLALIFTAAALVSAPAGAALPPSLLSTDLRPPATQEEALALAFAPDGGERAWGYMLHAAALVEGRWGGGLPVPIGRGQIGVGAQLVVDSTRCRNIDLGGEAAAFADNGGLGVSAAQWLSWCFGKNWMMFADVAGHHRLEWQVRPSLSALPRLWREPFTSESLDLEFTMAQLNFGAWQVGLGRTRFELGWMWQDDGAHLARSSDFGFGAAFVHITQIADSDKARPEDLTIDAVCPHFHLLLPAGFAGSDAAGIFDLGIARVGGLRLGTPRLLLDAEVGYDLAFSDVTTTAPGKRVTSSTDVDAFVGRLALRGGGGRVRAGGAVSRTLDSTFDGHVVLENRLETSMSLRRGRALVDLSTFVTRTAIFLPTGDRQNEYTGGGAARVTVDVGHHLDVGLTAEAARTFYARLDGGSDGQPRAALALRALGVLTARFGREPRPRERKPEAPAQTAN